MATAKNKLATAKNQDGEGQNAELKASKLRITYECLTLRPLLLSAWGRGVACVREQRVFVTFLDANLAGCRMRSNHPRGSYKNGRHSAETTLIHPNPRWGGGRLWLLFLGTTTNRSDTHCWRRITKQGSHCWIPIHKVELVTWIIKCRCSKDVTSPSDMPLRSHLSGYIQPH